MIKLYYPLLDIDISSYFGERWGKMHNGIDFKAPEGTDVMASADGYVIWTGYSGSFGKWNDKKNDWDEKPSGYGNCIFILHKNGNITSYAHLKDYNVEYGQYVKQGEIIGHSGNTGGSTGPHLHFELINGKQKNKKGELLAIAIASQGKAKNKNDGTKAIGINGHEGRLDPFTGKTAKELKNSGICYPLNFLNKNNICGSN